MTLEKYHSIEKSKMRHLRDNGGDFETCYQ